MSIDDFIHDAEADREMNAGVSSRRKVTKDEHRDYMCKQLLDALKRVPSDGTYLRAHQQTYDKFRKNLEQISVVPTGADVNFFLTNPLVQREIDKDIGLFLSALVNEHMENGAVIHVGKPPFIDFFGYQLNKDVRAVGDLRDHTAFRMKDGKLTVEGNCDGVVGEYQENGTILVRGKIRDKGAVRYGGTLWAPTVLRDYYHFSGIQDLRGLLENESDPFSMTTKQALEWGLPIDLHQRIREVLDERLVKIACKYNIRIYEKKIEPCQRQYDEQIERFNKLAEEWNKQINLHKSGKGVAGFGGVAALSGFILPPMFLVGGIYALAGIGGTLHAGNKLGKMEPELERLKHSISVLEGTIDSYRAKILQAYQF